MNHWEKAIDYVREKKTWTDAEEEVALDLIDRMRCPLSMTSTGSGICDEIRSLLDEYGEENDLPEDWWVDFGTEEDLFFKL